MKLRVKSWLHDIVRYDSSFDKSNYRLRLDQSERIIPFSDVFFKQFLSEIKQEDIITYPTMGTLKQKLADIESVQPHNLFISAGSDQCIKAMFETAVEPGDNIVTTDPCFIMYDIYAQLFKANVKKANYNAEMEYFINDIINLIDNNTKLVILANPNSPIGDYKYAMDLRPLFDITHEKGILVLMDEAYINYTKYPSNSNDYWKVYDNVVISRTFSKGLGAAGIRLGYLIGDKNTINIISKWRNMYPVSGLSIRFACYLLDNLDEVNAYLNETIYVRDKLFELFTEAGFDTMNSNCNWIHFNNKKDNRDVDEILKQYPDVLYKGGCRIPHDSRANWIRLTVGANLIREEVIQKILKNGTL